jgi:hypothetical protein
MTTVSTTYRIRQKQEMLMPNGSTPAMGALAAIDHLLWTSPDTTSPATFRVGGCWHDLVLDSVQANDFTGYCFHHDSTIPNGTEMDGTFTNLSGYLPYREGLNPGFSGAIFNKVWSLIVEHGKPYLFSEAGFTHELLRLRGGVDNQLSSVDDKFTLIFNDVLSWKTQVMYDATDANYYGNLRSGSLISNPCVSYSLAMPVVPQSEFLPVYKYRSEKITIGTPPYTFEVPGPNIVEEMVGFMLVEIYEPPFQINRMDRSILDFFFAEEAGPFNQDGYGIDCFAICTHGSEDVIAECLTHAYDGASKGQLDLLTTLIESPQTLSMFISLFRRLVPLVQAYQKLRYAKKHGIDPEFYAEFIRKRLNRAGFRKHEWDSFLRSATTASNIWLELRYGWRQLAIDFQDAMKAFRKVQSAKIRTTFSWTKSFPGVANPTDLEKSDLISTQVEQDDVQFRRTIGYDSMSSLTFSLFGSAEMRAGIGCDGWSNTMSMRIDQALGNLNYMRTLWETIPLSFVLDWFLDVGSVVGAGSFQYGQVTRKWRSATYSESSSVVHVTESIHDIDFANRLRVAFPSTSVFDTLAMRGIARCIDMRNCEGHRFYECKSRVYIRTIYTNPSEVPVAELAIPQGPLINSWQQIMDIVTLLITKRKVR